MIRSIESDPSNKGDDFYLFSKKARKKLDSIRLQIAYNIRESKIARGESINSDGYSGRKSNKR
jgi:hypothetical protein